jgi:hypothetical protein
MKASRPGRPIKRVRNSRPTRAARQVVQLAMYAAVVFAGASWSSLLRPSAPERGLLVDQAWGSGGRAAACESRAEQGSSNSIASGSKVSVVVEVAG